MLRKLAFKNIGKSIRDYAVYFFTLAFGVCIFYMFNSIYAQQAMMDLTDGKKQFAEAIQILLSYVSVFVAIMLGFLIIYANHFFIKRRKKELGIYMTLGMNKPDISMILVLETSLMAVCALITGLTAGVFLSQFMSLFTARLFEADLTHFRFIFSPGAVGKSTLYFGIIFLIVILFNTFAISRFKLIDLIYGGRKNEKLGIRSVKLCALLCVVSMLLLGWAYHLILENKFDRIGRTFFTSILLGILGTVLFFYSLSGLLLFLIRSRKKVYYSGLNMFITRQLGSRVTTNFISVSMVCLVLLLTIGVFSIGYSIQADYSEQLRDIAPYDFTLRAYGASEDDDYCSFSGMMEIMEAHPDWIDGYSRVNFYASQTTYGDLQILLSPDGNQEEWDGYLSETPLHYIKLSDFNSTMNLNGQNAIELGQNECALVVNFSYFMELAENMIAQKVTVPLNGSELIPTALIPVPLTNMDDIGMVLVVDDNYALSGLYLYSCMNIMTTGKNAAADLTDALEQLRVPGNDYHDSGFSFYYSQEEIHTASIGTRALFSFFSIYLGLTFMITCCAVLAIQQLSDAADNKYRYELLSKLGADSRMQNRALFVQILTYFLLPLLLAVVHSVVGLYAANGTLKNLGVDVSDHTLMTALFVGFLYVAYFLMTYIGSRRIISKKESARR